MISVILFFTSLFAFSNVECEQLFEARHESKTQALKALECYATSTGPSREAQSVGLTRQAYLKFFIAEYYLEQKTSTLFEGMALAEKSMLLFGQKYSLTDYRLLSPAETKLLAEALYTYGLCIARYIDLMGTMEALKRMGDIKKSMSTIMRLKEDAVAHFGAHRTMGIFHTKVPSIAGGDFKLAGELLLHALEQTRHKDGVSSYPANNVAYADWLHQANRKAEGCAQLKLVAELKDSDILNLNNGLYFESLADVTKAKELLKARCSR